MPKELIVAARASLMALESNRGQWQGEGYCGDYFDDEIAALRAALLPLQAYEPLRPSYWPQWCINAGFGI